MGFAKVFHVLFPQTVVINAHDFFFQKERLAESSILVEHAETTHQQKHRSESKYYYHHGNKDNQPVLLVLNSIRGNFLRQSTIQWP